MWAQVPLSAGLIVGTYPWELWPCLTWEHQQPKSPVKRLRAKLGCHSEGSCRGCGLDVCVYRSGPGDRDNEHPKSVLVPLVPEGSKHPSACLKEESLEQMKSLLLSTVGN